jgi:5-formyltetrahydrofolate cyclo-ligase
VPESGPNGLLTWRTLESDFANNLTTDSQGMPVPVSGESALVKQLDAVLVPAAAVDRDGNRLGWGKGYYDRFLDGIDPNTVVIAVVFDSDVIDSVPVETHDKKVNLIVTEADIYRVRI